MESVINQLPEEVFNQIAAGEVVSRPASAVKEMLENAVDAGATEIELHVQDAGRTLIQVVDNGCGMSAEDAQKCFLPHATSKLLTADDLLRLTTMGFRGEALASIAAVAQVELQTRREQDEIGTQVNIEGGKILSTEPCACPKGTCIKLKNIYFNTPARRQFLKSDDVEYRYIEEEFNRVALARPEIKFSFYRNGQRLYLLEAGKTKQRIVQIMGKSFEARLVKVAERLSEAEITGYLCTPDYTVKGRGKQFIFVNRRFIKHFGLGNAVEKAYEGLLAEGKNAVFFLYLKVNPEDMDVNIHPTKTEVRFKDERLLYGLLMSAGKHALGVNQMRGNALDFESSEALPYQYRPKDYVPPQPQVAIRPGYDPFKETHTDSSVSEDYRRAYAQSFAQIQRQPDFRPQPTQLEMDCCEEVMADAREALKESILPQSKNTARIFQIFDSYIVTPLRSGLAVIDQQAASERIIYNDYAEKKGAAMPSQSTLFPQTIEFSAAKAEMMKDVLPTLNTLGWSIEWVGGNGFMVNAIPVDLTESRVEDTLNGLLDSYAAGLMKAQGGMQDNLARALARELSVKQGTPLENEEILYLANRLFSGPEPEVSPSGKRVLWMIGEKEIVNKLS